MREGGLRRTLPEQLSGSGNTSGTPRQSITDPILSKRVCFYKSGDPQFSGLRVVINNRTFKSFDALLDSLSKKVPLPFGVRNITTPRGVHTICNLDELEDGKSYICSDSRKVIPINLATAKKKLPPWYHVRPLSSRRRTVQKARFFPGRNFHKRELVVMRTPKKLLVFSNGDPSVRRTVVLQKSITPTFESILEHISEVMKFPVVKLHTTDGRRVDGLPGLILCSGTVVAAGREPFRPANYNAQKPAAPTRLPSNRMSGRRLKALNHIKKASSYTSKPRIFSPSSERYIVGRIHNSIAQSSHLPSNHTNSIELESSRILESVAETEAEDEAEGGDNLLPNDDDIEKSFRVNQDGSMTVEMRVRLTIKEEETVHWTTTLTRSSLANELTFLRDPESVEEINSVKSNPLDLQTAKHDEMKETNDEEPPALSNGGFSENSFEEDRTKAHTDVVAPQRTPTPGQKHIRTKQASVENIKSITSDGIQEGMVGSYSYREQTENGGMTEQHCMVKQSSSRPVPKPRRLGSVDANSRQVSTFKSAEILQIESSEEEVTETVLHIYEQQTCQDNFCAQGMSASAITFCGLATSDRGHHSCSSEFEPEPWRPSTDSESISVWRAESTPLTSDLTLPSQKTSAIPSTNAQEQFKMPTKTRNKPKLKEAKKDKRGSPKAKVSNKDVNRLTPPGQRQKKSSAEATEKRKRGKTFSSAGFIKRIYGKPSKNKLKKREAQNKEGGVITESSQQSDDVKDPNIPPPVEENANKAVSLAKSSVHVSPPEASQLKGTLTRQTSVHQEQKSLNDSCGAPESMSLPAFNSSSPVINEYVAEWLEKAQLKPTISAEDESKKARAVAPLESESGRTENELDLTASDTEPQPESSPVRSVKQRIQSFESKSSGTSVEKVTGTHVTNQIITTDKHKQSLPQTNTDEIKPLSSGVCYEISPPTTTTETSPDIEVESKSRPIKIQFQKATSLNTSMELPPPPPPETLMELSVAEQHGMDLSSVVSSPLYRVSSVGSHMSDIPPLSDSPTSDKAISPSDHSMAMTTSIETDNPSKQMEAPLPRVPSIKRTPLVSNLSLERKMSLRKASVDKHTLCSNATSSVPITAVADDVLPNGICLTETQQRPEETQLSSSTLDLTSSQSCCTSPSPASVTSEERESSASILSSQAPTPSNLLCKETKVVKTLSSTQKEASSPKPSVKKVKLIKSPSPETKLQTKKISEVSSASPKLSSLHKHPSGKSMSPNIGRRKPPTAAASPVSERKQKIYKTKQTMRVSPYSQSLDVASPPVRHKTKRLCRNLSSDSASEAAKQTQRKPSPLITLCKSPQPTELKTPTHDTPEVPLKSENEASQPNMQPVLEEICSLIKAIREMTQNKRQSCRERPSNPPDFSSHVALTFGSSSRTLLAFLSVMALKDSMLNVDTAGLNASDVRWVEAFNMIDSLRDSASIEDSQKLNDSLSSMQRLASEELLQNWRGFQEFSEKCRRSVEMTEDEAMDELIDHLDVPQVLKEELASLSVQIKSESDHEDPKSVRMTENQELTSHQCNLFSDTAPEDKTNVAVSSTVQKFSDIHQPQVVSCKVNPEEGQNASSATKIVEQGQSATGLETSVKEGELANLKGNAAQEGQLNTSYYVELRVSRNKSRSCPQSESSPVSEVGCEAWVLSKPAGPPIVETREQAPAGGTGPGKCVSNVDEVPLSERKQQIFEPKRLKAIVEESLSDAEREQQEIEASGLKAVAEKSMTDAESKRLKVIVEENLSEEQESVEEEEEEHALNTIEEEGQDGTEEIGEIKVKVSSEDENNHTNKNSLSEFIENRDLNTVQDTSRFINHCETGRTDAEEDRGNDHSGCEDHADIEQPKTDEPFSSSEELSHYEKELSSEEEHAVTGRSRKESQQVKMAEAKKSDTAADNHQCEEMISQSVAERVSLLEKQVDIARKRSSDTRSSSTRHFVSDIEYSSSESPSSQSALCTRSAPQSSLSFSYDSSSVITTQPESNRVKSIREMFLAKSPADIQQGQKRFPSPKSSDVSDLRADASVSGGYQSQTSSELSSGDDDSSHKSIAKGFVRRTIERLYGKKDSHSDVDENGERSPSASKQKQKQKEHTSIFSPFHTARCKAMSDLSYFNSTNTLDTLSEATRCLAFNAQVGPGGSVSVDEGPWLLKENTLIRKSVSDPVGINKTVSNSPQKEGLCEDTEDSSPYSLFSTKSDLEDSKKSVPGKCTYFSLPHGSDSELCQDDTGAETKDKPDDTKTWAERNGTLPGVVISDFKMMDNKVHPLVEAPAEVVVSQPCKNQAVVNRVPEIDVLDILYNFCVRGHRRHECPRFGSRAITFGKHRSK